MLRTARIIALFLIVAAPWALFAQGGQPAKPSKDRLALVQAEKAYVAAKKAYTTDPKTPATRKRYVDATVGYGTKTMLSPLLAPKEKYPKALRLYREALQVDPANKEALENKAMIEQIYKSMNRPIPKG